MPGTPPTAIAALSVLFLDGDAQHDSAGVGDLRSDGQTQRNDTKVVVRWCLHLWPG
jgi:hypothetical protein